MNPYIYTYIHNNTYIYTYIESNMLIPVHITICIVCRCCFHTASPLPALQEQREAEADKEASDARVPPNTQPVEKPEVLGGLIDIFDVLKCVYYEWMV